MASSFWGETLHPATGSLFLFLVLPIVSDFLVLTAFNFHSLAKNYDEIFYKFSQFTPGEHGSNNRCAFILPHAIYKLIHIELSTQLNPEESRLFRKQLFLNRVHNVGYIKHLH